MTDLVHLGLAAVTIWVGLILIHSILRHTLARHRTYQIRILPPPPAAADTDDQCFTSGCDRRAGWRWWGADLVNRRQVCWDCGQELTATRGGFMELK